MAAATSAGAGGEDAAVRGRVVGADVLLYASDYPHWDSDWPHTVKTVRERTDMTDQLEAKVLAETPCASTA